MTDTPQIPSQITLTDFGGPSRMLGRTTDESLFLEAITRWEDSRQRLLELTANVPSVHACITQWLKQTLNLDGDSVQVHFLPRAIRQTATSPWLRPARLCSSSHSWTRRLVNNAESLACKLRRTTQHAR